MTTVEQRALIWLLGPDTGISSKTIAAHMLRTPMIDWPSHPRDGGDFGRCVRLLRLIPEWNARQSEMGQVSEEWAALLPIWDDLERRYDAKDFGGLYDEIKRVTRPIEDKRDDVIRMSDTATMRFAKGKKKP